MKTKTCKKCKARVLDRYRLCHQCGAAVGEGSAPLVCLLVLTSLLVGCLVVTSL